MLTLIRMWMIWAFIFFNLTAYTQRIHELTDRKGLVYERNIRNWKWQRIDSMMFDIYYPTGATSNKKYPVYFGLYGGSFIEGSRRAVSQFADDLADEGFIVVCPDYRVGYKVADGCKPGDDSSAMQIAIYRAMQDVNACMRYVTNHAKEFNVDTAWVFLGGSSAGSTIAENAAYVNDSLSTIHYPDSVAVWGTLQTSGNKEPYNYRIKGLCNMWGGLPAWDSLINSKSAIPSILFKGGKDVKVPNGVGYFDDCPYSLKLRAGQGIYDEMISLKVPCVFHFQPQGPHPAYDNKFNVANTACFFKALISKKPYSGYFTYYDASCR